ncbi:HD domain-containing protein [Micromonospora sp. NPDC005652]|uniref:HD domain-containing protein n=1 Tax=Micromonospora sp. NPDC005652 TaxID=3157046 RepID=UPI0033D7DE80
MPTIAKTLALAARAHAGQRDHAGRDYIDHPLAVAALLSRHGREAVLAGLLHDVVEDSETTLADLCAMGYSDLVVDTVDSVTARPGEEYADRVLRAAAHPLGKHVKLADLTHNTWPARVAVMAAISPAKAKRAAELAQRYADARAVLLNAGATLEPAVEAVSGDPEWLPCPVLSQAGGWCAKPTYVGWTPSEGHGGGHFWTTYRKRQIVRGGHFDGPRAIADGVVDGHTPESCPGPDGCAFWPVLGRAEREVVLARLGGTR